MNEPYISRQIHRLPQTDKKLIEFLDKLKSASGGALRPSAR